MLLMWTAMITRQVRILLAAQTARETMRDHERVTDWPRSMAFFEKYFKPHGPEICVSE